MLERESGSVQYSLSINVSTLEVCVLAEELLVSDTGSPLWRSVRPLLEVALKLEQNDTSYSWHGWNKQQIQTFLVSLPTPCALVVGVWTADGERDVLTLGCVCEVVEGEVHSLRTFDALPLEDLPPLHELEPDFEHALAIMRAVRLHVAPVAWALFTDKETWDEWLLTGDEKDGVIDKGEQLATLARQGRCVLLGSQTSQAPQ